MRALGTVLFLVFALPGCVRLGSPEDSDAGASDSAGSGGASSGSVRATGTNCGVDPNSGISLCLGISLCPGLRVDPEQFPDCGFRVAGSRIDLECSCGDALCPIGTAASCLDAKALLSEQTAQSACAGVAEGRCEIVKQGPASLASTCDKDCRAQCSGAPGCITLCGC